MRFFASAALALLAAAVVVPSELVAKTAIPRAGCKAICQKDTCFAVAGDGAGNSCTCTCKSDGTGDCSCKFGGGDEE